MVDHINKCNTRNYPINSSGLTASIISLISAEGPGKFRNRF